MPTEATKKDLFDVLHMVRELHDDDRGGEMPAAVLATLSGMVGCESASYCRVDHVSRRILAAVSQPVATDLSDSAGFAAVLDQHPAFVAHRERRMTTGRSVALTDLVDLPTLRNLPIYADFYRPRETHDQLLNIVTVGRRQGSVIVFNRSRRGFSGRTRELVDIVSPHVCQAVAHRERLVTLTTALRDARRNESAVESASDRLPSLTPREREIALRLVDGLGDREIARALGVSPRTVHKHLEQVYRKLGLHSRAGVVAAMSRPSRAEVR